MVRLVAFEAHAPSAALSVGSAIGDSTSSALAEISLWSTHRARA
ncbi:hypothetical protein I545_5579 [Mycobacterium kansasii 662]|nr:hypothetical protein I545_5579 [Mycobacterium kansasii 662]KEP42262.1 hypothetical protein MKSMC1_26390 [Mycobacterium kansasii]